MKDLVKATISIKAESLSAHQGLLETIAERAGMTIVADATLTTSMAIESSDTDDLRDALTEIAKAIQISDGVEAKIAAPSEVWQGRTTVAGPTPMERMINQATGELFA